MHLCAVNNWRVSTWWYILTLKYRICFFLNQKMILFLILPFSIAKKKLRSLESLSVIRDWNLAKINIDVDCLQTWCTQKFKGAHVCSLWQPHTRRQNHVLLLNQSPLGFINGWIHYVQSYLKCSTWIKIVH